MLYVFPRNSTAEQVQRGALMERELIDLQISSSVRNHTTALHLHIDYSISITPILGYPTIYSKYILPSFSMSKMS